jgi:hypothetical protein
MQRLGIPCRIPPAGGELLEFLELGGVGVVHSEYSRRVRQAAAKTRGFYGVIDHDARSRLKLWLCCCVAPAKTL